MAHLRRLLRRSEACNVTPSVAHKQKRQNNTSGNEFVWGAGILIGGQIGALTCVLFC
jgi:hypothetical protein